MIRWAIIFLLLCGAYGLFVGPFSLSEVLAAIPAVLGGFGFALLHDRIAERPLAVRMPWRVLANLSMALVKNSALVGRALLQTVSGSIAVQPFDPGGADADSAGRRAAVILGASLAPNGYVVRVTDNALLLHQLVPSPAKPNTKWPL
jgi:hypothetical protein